MGLALMLWLLVSLLSISLVGNHPLWALGLGAVGGIGVGIFLFLEADRAEDKRQTTDGEAEPSSVFPWSAVRGPGALFLLFLPLILMLLFANRLPQFVSVLSAVLLLCLWGYCRWTGIGGRTPLDLPIFLLLLLPATTGLYASPDFTRTVADVFQLTAGIGFFYGIVYAVHSETRLRWGVIVFMCLGAVLASGSLLVMQASTVKLPVLGRAFAFLPNILPRRVNPNYIGGVLVLFVFLPVWRLVWRRGRCALTWVALGAVGLGLLLAQSRGALLGAVLAMGFTMMLHYRWARYGLLPLIAGGAFLFFQAGMDAVLDPVGGAGANRTFEGRLELWQRGIYIVQDFSFTGIGFHAFPVVVDLLYPLFLIGPNAKVPHAHNFFLQVAVDMGIPGFVAFSMLLGAWGSMVWAAFRNTSRGSAQAVWRPVVLGLCGGMAAHLLYGVMDAIALGEKAGVVFWAVLALTVCVWQQVRTGGDREVQG